MAVNHKSGRIVVDIDLELKRALHAKLLAEGLSLKEWFVELAIGFVNEQRRPKLAAEPATPRSSET